MGTALAAHDEVLGAAVEGHGGWLFKHTGDGVCAAFSTAGDAVAAAVDAQRGLGLPVRMGLATGEAEPRGDDYFGSALNRAARVMAAGHGGQILVANSTAALVSGAGLVDLGERRLRDLSGAEHLYQVHAEELRAEFPPLRTVDAVPGNLPVLATSFVGRDVEVKELGELVRAHRMVTLTGVGGVGKTRLAVQVAAELTGEFGDGVWLVELASVGDPAAVADVVATTLGVTAQAGMSVTASVAQALSGRRLLVVLDNCEHVLDAAADLVETILGRTSTVKVLATSREGLRVGAEQLWVVPSLGVDDGMSCAAVELFVERARSVNAGFALHGDPDVEAVREICARLDGIALAIELAAARMVAMRPQDVRDRLGDRFRLLAGARRGVERHQTLRHVVAWSYELLEDTERALLNCCSVFAGGFDLAAAGYLGDGVDEFAVLDGLESLVRKSLITVDHSGGHARYGMLETIRQYAEELLAATGSIADVRDRHAKYFAGQAVVFWELWDGPDQRVALDWFDAEFANLRAGFRWATDGGDLTSAAAIAAHATMLGITLQRFEPVGWAEELLPAALTAEVAQLPRLYIAASVCSFTGRPEVAVGYAESAIRLEPDPRYDAFPNAWNQVWEANAHFYAGRPERALEIYVVVAAQSGPAHVAGLCVQITVLGSLGWLDEAAAIAEEALTAARAHANPFYVAQAHFGYAIAYRTSDPARALRALREGLAYTRDHRQPILGTAMATIAASIEAAHGDLDRAFTLYDSSIDSLHQAGNNAHLAAAFTALASSFHRLERSDIAATLYGSATQLGTTMFTFRPDRLRAALGEDTFERCAATGAAMERAEAVRYARTQIQLAREALREAAGSSPRRAPDE